MAEGNRMGSAGLRRDGRCSWFLRAHSGRPFIAFIGSPALILVGVSLLAEPSLAADPPNLYDEVEALIKAERWAELPAKVESVLDIKGEIAAVDSALYTGQVRRARIALVFSHSSSNSDAFRSARDRWFVFVDRLTRRPVRESVRRQM